MKKRAIDILIIILIITLGIVLRFPFSAMDKDSSSRSIAEINEITDEDCLYLSDPDSYLYARKAREYSVDLSNFTFVNTREDDYMMNPVSDRENGLVTNGLSFIAAIVYRFLSFFSHISVEQIVYYIDMVICSLAAIPAYLYVRKQTNVIGGIVSGILAVCAIPFFVHSVAGYFDTDAMLCTIPLALMTSFAMMIYSDKRSTKIVFSIISLIMFALLAATWETFYIYFGILVFLSVITIIIMAILCKKEKAITGSQFKEEVLFSCITIVIMAIIAFLMYGMTIVDSVRRLVTNMLVTNDYPDSTKYIVELSDIPILENGIEGAFLTTGSGIINNLGGVVILVVGLLSMILVIAKGKERSPKFFSCNFGFIVTWLLVTFPLLFVGVRFLQLVCLPLVLLIGLGIGIFTDMLVKNSNIYIGSVLSAFISAIIMVGPVAGVILRGNAPAPFYTRTFDKACTWVNDYASEDASILTWWDYGYFIQFASARHVLADGGTFDGGYFYWLAHALLTDNPKLSAAIFSMLDDSGISAPDMATEYIGDTSKACDALLSVLPMSKEEGIQYLVKNYDMSEDKATILIDKAKPDMRNEEYMFISRDLISKINALCYYGFYDFSNGDYDAALGVSCEPIAPNEYNQHTEIQGINNCSIEYREVGDNKEVTIIDDDGNPVGISRLIFVENGSKVQDIKRKDTGYTVYCIKDNGECSFIVCSNFIADSMLVSLMAYNSNDCYERVYSSVEDSRLLPYNSVIAKFFGNASTKASAGVLVYRMK